MKHQNIGIKFIKSILFYLFLSSSIFGILSCQGPSGDDAADPSIVTYSISGNIIGQTGDVILQNNGGDDLTVSSGTSDFTFATPLADKANYLVTVKTNPTGQFCSISNNVGQIDAANVIDVQVICTTVFQINGTVTDNGSMGNSGSTVYVYAFPSDDSGNGNISFLPYDEISVTSGSAVLDDNFSINVPVGTYRLRAYRDAGGPNESPDSLPTLGFDPQSPLSSPITITNANSTGHDLILESTANRNAYNFDVYSLNKTAEKSAPKDNADQDGLGFCGGFLLKMEATKNNSDSTTIPKVLSPSGGVIELQDDGGCSGAVADNRNSSYDKELGDGDFSYGIDSPVAANAGNYLFYYVNNEASDYIHVQVDNIGSIIKLSRQVTITTGPDGSTRDHSKTVTWNPVSGATEYGFGITNYVSFSYLINTDGATTHDISGDLVDNTTYGYQIYPIVSDNDSSSGKDAVSYGSFLSFFHDPDGDQSVEFSGSLTNNTSSTGNYHICGSGIEDLDCQAKVVVNATSTSYSLYVSKSHDSTSDGTIKAVIDDSNTGDPSNSLNDPYRQIFRHLDTTANVALDITWNTMLTLVSPADGAINVGNTPTFRWEDYKGTAGLPADWSYIVFAFDPDKQMNSVSEIPIIYSVNKDIALVGGNVNFDLSSVPVSDSVDLQNLYGNDSSSDLSQNDNWSWGVFVISCAYDATTDCIEPELDANNSPAWISQPEMLRFATNTPSYSIGGTITGQSGNVVLQNNGGDNLTVSSGAIDFTFTTPVTSGESYNVTVLSSPLGQECSVVSNGSGQANDDVINVQVICSTKTYTVRGTITGQSGDLILQNNTEILPVSGSAGTFEFAVAVSHGNAYSVTVVDYPVGQSCNVDNGSGTINGADVTDVVVTCSTASYQISGSISGHTGDVVLQNNGVDDKTVIMGQGSFSFTTLIPHGDTYDVSVLTHPTGQNCSVSQASGTVNGAEVTTVEVECVNLNYQISGTISGQTGDVVLKNSGGDDLDVLSTATEFTFATAVPHGNAYAVTVETPPVGQTCSVSNGSGTINGTDVTDVVVTCSVNFYDISGGISDHSGSVVLQNNGGDNQTLLISDSEYTFADVPDGSGYNITVLTPPVGQSCSVANNPGTVSGANVTAVDVTCTTNSYTISGTITGHSGDVTLQNNAGDDLTISTGTGVFTFSESILHEGAYDVSVLTLPTGQSCDVSNEYGTVNGANVTDIVVTCFDGYRINGTVTDFGSMGNSGSKVYVFAYADPDNIAGTQLFDELDVTDGDEVNGVNFSIIAPAGTYWLRAYRDANGPIGTADGLPTLGSDPQSSLSGAIEATTDSGSSSSIGLILKDTADTNAFGFDVFSLNNTWDQHAPIDASGDDGLGLCDGFILQIHANKSNTSVSTTEPKVLMPDGSVVTLKDDGACSDAVADNSGSSYDRNMGDNLFSYGINAPVDDPNAGIYQLFYVNKDTSDDFLHIYKDEIESIVQLDRFALNASSAINGPDGSGRDYSATPTITWDPVTNADGYEFAIYYKQPVSWTNIYSYRDTGSTHTIEVDLTDDTSYAYYVWPIVSDNDNSGKDAVSYGTIARQFVRDIDGDGTVEISGSITNNFGSSDEYFACGSGSGSGYLNSFSIKSYLCDANIILPSGAEEYSLYVLKNDVTFDGFVLMKMDISGTGFYLDEQNNKTFNIKIGLDTTGDITQDFIIYPAIDLTSPTNGAAGTGNTPTFEWEDYSGTLELPTDWCYVLTVSDSAGSYPIMYSIEDTTNSFDMSSVPVNSIDIVSAYNSGSKTSLPDLSRSSNWGWNIVIVECAYDNSTCIINSLSSWDGVISGADIWPFTTD